MESPDVWKRKDCLCHVSTWWWKVSMLEGIHWFVWTLAQNLRTESGAAAVIITYTVMNHLRASRHTGAKKGALRSIKAVSYHAKSDDYLHFTHYWLHISLLKRYFTSIYTAVYMNRKGLVGGDSPGGHHGQLTVFYLQKPMICSFFCIIWATL